MTTIRNLILVLAVLNGIFAAEGVADMTHNGFSLSPSENKINFYNTRLPTERKYYWRRGLFKTRN